MSTTQSRNKAIFLKKGARKHSSHQWLTRQLNDPYVTQAKLDGYRSRAAYKILEIHEKFNLFKKSMNVIDLGAAPGGWSQVATKYIGSTGLVIAIDLLEIDPIAGVSTLQMDFCDKSTPHKIMEILDSHADIVMSDMAANTTGHAATDHLRIIDLCERSFCFAEECLKPGGSFVAKILRGGTESALLAKVKQRFSVVKHFKPKSSRADSKEIYLIAMGFKSS